MSESYTMDDYIKENIIDSVNEKLKAYKELKIKIKIKEIEKDFEDETL